jgi:hypothetical protein
MSFVCPLPPYKVYVRAEYLYDHQKGHGEFVEGIWVSVKSLPGQAFRFETWLPETGALFDKLPISAFVSEAQTPNPDLPLDFLQIWDAMSYDVTVIDKPFLAGQRCEMFAKDRQAYRGEYLFTIDGAHLDRRVPDYGFSETPEDHKSFNVILLDNGQYAAQPNNRMRFSDPAFSPASPALPDYKVCTRIYSVEQTAKWRLGETSSMTYDDAGEP